MTSSEDIPLSEEDKTQFKLLDVIYLISKGYRFAHIPIGRLYDGQDARTDKEKQVVKESYEYLRKGGLAKSKSIGNVSITHKGIKEFDLVMLNANVCYIYAWEQERILLLQSVATAIKLR